MKRKYGFVVALLCIVLAVGMVFTIAYTNSHETNKEDGLTVVTSFYPMYIAAMNIVGETEGVTLKNLSEPKTGCLHDYQLTPSDMKLLSTADVFLVNGGGIEGFLAETAASNPKLVIVNTSDGINLLKSDTEHIHEHEGEIEDEHEHGEAETDEHEHDHGEWNAHAWLSVSDYMKQISNMAEGLAAADASHAAIYRENANQYKKKLEPLLEEISVLKEEVSGSSLVSFHAAYAYIARDLGMNTIFTMDLDEERQISAGEVAEAVNAIAEGNVSVVLADEIYGRDMGNAVTKETAVNVVYLDTLVTGEYDKDSYIAGMKENIRLLKEALSR